jgi:hypothetical protein
MARTVMTGMTSNVRALHAPYVLLLLFSSPSYGGESYSTPTLRASSLALPTDVNLPSCTPPNSRPPNLNPPPSPPPLLLPFQPPNCHLPNRSLVQQQETRSSTLINTVNFLMVHYQADCNLVLVIHSVTVKLLMVYNESKCNVLLLRRHIHRRGHCRLWRRRGCDDVTLDRTDSVPGNDGSQAEGEEEESVEYRR